MKLKNKVAMVTGAASGIGKAVSLAMAKEGSKLILIDLDLEGLEITAKQTGLPQESLLIDNIDVTNFNKIELLIEHAVEKFGRIDIQANIAGVLIRKGLFQTDIEEWEKVLKINLSGVFICIKAVAPYMIKQKYGKIINMGSIAGLVGYIYPSYCASKAGVINLTRGLMMDLAPHNININAICPGPIKTGWTPADATEKMLEKIPSGRFGLPEDVASLAVYLATDESSFINGAAITIDGGSIAGHEFI